MSATINKLLIRVNGEPAGYLAARKTDDGATRYSFTYLPDAAPEQALSLTMPVRAESYVSGYLPPILEMSLPEGRLKAHLISRFGKPVTMNEMGLLFISGRSRIGNIAAELPPGAGDAELTALENTLALEQRQQDAISSEEITGVTDAELVPLFESLLARYATGSGVCGVQTKVLATTREPISGNPAKLTIRTPRHIVKTSDDDVPYLALNEDLCLEVACRAGLDVPRRVLSDNGEVIILERFDLTPDGSSYFFEDGCVLLNKPATDKYEGSMEKLADVLLAAVSGDRRLATGRTLFRQVAVNALVRNGDAHLKNFAIMYDRPGNVRLAKAFDITTTSAYMALRDDMPALQMNNSRRWPSQKDLVRFGRERCRLEQRDCLEIIGKVVDAVTAVGKTIPKEIEKRPGSEHVLSAMAQCWNDAIKTLHVRKDKDRKAIQTELDGVEKSLFERYGDPRKGQKDRDERLRMGD